MDVNLVSFDSMLGIMSIGIVLWYFLAPSIVILLAIYSIRTILKNKKVKNTKVKEINPNGLDGIDLEPKDKSKFRSLSLSFDETGRVVN